jgi:hypothetical protein
MSYSPPESNSPSAKKRGHPNWRHDPNIPSSGDYPLPVE